MIRAEKQSLFDGNTVLAPEFEPWKKSKEYDELEKAKAALNAKKRHLRVMAKVRVLTVIVALSMVGLTIIFRYSQIFDMQKALVDESRKVNQAVLTNENLGLQLAKYTDINQVEDVAINKLHMVKADKGNAAFVDLNKENFSHTAAVKENNNNDLLEKIKAFLF